MLDKQKHYEIARNMLKAKAEFLDGDQKALQQWNHWQQKLFQWYTNEINKVIQENSKGEGQ